MLGRRGWCWPVCALQLLILFSVPVIAAESVPSPVIAVVDFQRIARESSAGKIVRSRVDEQHAAFQDEIKSLQVDLEKIRAILLDQKSTTATSEITEKRKEFEAKSNDLQRLVQLRKRQLDQMYVEGMRRVESELVEVLKEIAADRGVNLILNAARGQGIVLYADNSIIITDEARKRLDRRLPTLVLNPPDEAETIPQGMVRPIPKTKE